MIFTEQFYPTPPELANKMVSLVDWKRVNKILEPSAGTGNLVKAITSKRKHIDVDCAEIDPKLQAILKDAGFNVVASDFLTAPLFTRYDAIIMNPPFRNGIHHLIKAVNLVEKSGGQVVCLLNASSMTKTDLQGKILSTLLNKYEAKVEYLQNAFSNAEVKTNVEVALIYLDIPSRIKTCEIPFEELTPHFNIKPVSDEVEGECKCVVEYDIIKQLVKQYNFEAQLGLGIIDQFKTYAAYVPPDANGHSLLSIHVSGGQSSNPQNDYLKELRKKYWAALFSSKEMRSLMPTQVYNDYMKQIDKLSDYDVTYENIYTIRLELSKFKMQSLEDAIMAMFDKLTYEHSLGNNSNIHYYNGWKTNNACAINDKVILSCYGVYDSRFNYWRAYRLDIIMNTLTELEKILNYFSNGILSFLDCSEIICSQVNSDYKSGTRIKCAYFDVAFFKKGSCHIWFTDLEVLKRFNCYGGKKKNWLPPHYGKVRYSDLDNDSRNIVDSFEGSKSYNESIETGSYNFELTDIKLLN